MFFFEELVFCCFRDVIETDKIVLLGIVFRLFKGDIRFGGS